MGRDLCGGTWLTFSWCVCVANLFHIRFFEAPLNWWVVREHLSDFFVVQDSARSFELHGAIWLSVACLLGSLILFNKLGSMSGQLSKPRRLFVGLGLILLLGWRGPAWINISDNGALLGDNIVRSWLLQTTRSRLFQGASSDWVSEVQLRQRDGKGHGWLRAYSEGKITRDSQLASAGLEKKHHPKTEDILSLRRRLGLPEEGPIHVVYLFLESVRSYELEHPKIGPSIFPRIREHIAQRGQTFRQAYSSSFEAGQTVRGQFSAFCSMLPNIGGAATYIAHTTLSIFCIQDYLKEQGYLQSWMNSHHSGYHNKRLFERRHGTTEFYDQAYFESVGIEEEIGSWGLADKPFLEASLGLLKEMSQDDTPVFANILTINTHHPQTVVPQGPVEQDLLDFLEADEAYHGLLSRYKYTDDAVGTFLDALFESELGARTLLVMVGDHSTRHEPPLAENAVQRYEARFRVPLVFMSKFSQPAQFDGPVHQIDITPTIAAVIGAEAETAWLGRNILVEPVGSAWVYQENGLVAYRRGSRGCYPNEAFDALACVDTTLGDPMFNVLPTLEEQVEETAFFKGVIDELVYLIAFDRIFSSQ